MLRRLVSVDKNKTILFNCLSTSIRSFRMTPDSAEVCSSTQILDISSITSKKSQRLSVNNLVLNSNNITQPLKEPRKLNHKLFSPEMPTECCNNQCDCCVWLLYVKEVALYYNGDKDKIEEALNLISNVETRNYVRENYESFD